MLYANVDSFGGNFLKTVEREFSDSVSVTIATGYVSFDIINKFYGDFRRIAAGEGTARLLLGMAFYEGLSSNKLSLLKGLGEKLENADSRSGVFVSYSGKYHGKVYVFDKGSSKRAYIGSSNFSRSGLAENIECTTLIKDAETQADLVRLVDYLFDPQNATSLLNADIIVPGSAEYGRKLLIGTLDDLERYNASEINTAGLPELLFPLSRIADKEKSNLNVYFGKGRWSRATGKVAPRPWYEVEIIADRSITSSPLYPKGDFLAYTDDGYIIPMKTSGDYFKNIRSRGNLSIFGQWIKGKLQKKGALVPLTPVTQDTLAAYGNDTIKFYKIDEGKYYIGF